MSCHLPSLFSSHHWAFVLDSANEATRAAWASPARTTRRPSPGNVKGSFRYGSGDYQTAVDLVASERISVKELITGKVSFEDAEKAFADVKAGKGIKILIEGPKE